MSKSKVLALMGVQILLMPLVLLSWSDQPVAAMLQYRFLLGYSSIQLMIHWGLWETPKKKKKNAKK